MRDVKPQVQYNVPQGTEVDKAVRKSSVVYVFIGKPVDAQGRVVGQESRVQVNDRLVSVSQIGEAIAQERSSMTEEDRQHLVVSIRADRDTEMGLINDVKQALRRADALNINYSAVKVK